MDCLLVRFDPAANSRDILGEFIDFLTVESQIVLFIKPDADCPQGRLAAIVKVGSGMLYPEKGGRI